MLPGTACVHVGTLVTIPPIDLLATVLAGYPTLCQIYFLDFRLCFGIKLTTYVHNVTPFYP